MKNIIVIILLLSGMYFIIPGCTAGNMRSKDNSKDGYSGSPVPQSSSVPVKSTVGGSAVVLKATAFKMNGNYSDNVGVTLDSEGNFLYYPAPSDITPNSRPVDLGGGWWLNRQGISENSVFTKYTFEEYSALKNVPTREELKKMIIPGSRVAGFRQLPYSASEAMNNLDAIKRYLNTNP